MLESNWKNKSKSKWQCSGDRTEVTNTKYMLLLSTFPPICNFLGAAATAPSGGSNSRRTILLDWLVAGLTVKEDSHYCCGCQLQNASCFWRRRGWPREATVSRPKDYGTSWGCQLQNASCFWRRRGWPMEATVSPPKNYGTSGGPAHQIWWKKVLLRIQTTSILKNHK